MSAHDASGGDGEGGPAFSEDVLALLSDERAAPGPEFGTADRVWASLESAIASAPGLANAPASQVASSGVPSSMVVGATLAGVIVGAILLLGAPGSTPVWAPHLDQASPAETASVAKRANNRTETPALAPSSLKPATLGVGPVVARASAIEKPSVAAPVPVLEFPVPEVPIPVAPDAAPEVPKSVLVADGSQPTTPDGESKRVLRPGTPVGPAPTKQVKRPPKPSERTILDAAHSALSSGRAALAISKAKEHRRYYPRGGLTQEREALWIRALVKAGRYQSARKRGAGFLKRFPRSLHGRAVRAALAKTPTPD